MSPPAPPTRPAFSDEVTALSTRTMMHATLGAALLSGVQAVVVLLAIDHFDDFDERHGHARGDELLRVTAALLREELATASCLARAGADRFVAFLPGRSLDAAVGIARHCVEAMREPVTLSCGAQAVTLSAGVATLGGQAGHAADAVWLACDAALQAAQARGRDRVVAFDGGTRQATARPLPDGVPERRQRHLAQR